MVNLCFRGPIQCARSPRGLWMAKHETRITLAKNLKYLMDRNGWKQVEMAQKAGVSQRSISNLLHPETHSPVLETVEAVAKAFGLNLWHLIMPTLIEDLESDTSIRKLFDAYEKADAPGRKLIQQVAEREAAHHDAHNK